MVNLVVQAHDSGQASLIDLVELRPWSTEASGLAVDIFEVLSKQRRNLTSQQPPTGGRHV